MSPDKLIYMANQIGKFFTSQGPDKAAAGIAQHIKRFDPRMRAAIFAHLDAGGAGLDPVVREAIDKLSAEQRSNPPPESSPGLSRPSR
jgi:formate dehydrogenase subunit delta